MADFSTDEAYFTVKPIKEMRQITLHVRIVQATELRWRIWLGVRLMGLAAWIMNCNLEIEGRGR